MGGKNVVENATRQVTETVLFINLDAQNKLYQNSYNKYIFLHLVVNQIKSNQLYFKTTLN